MYRGRRRGLVSIEAALANRDVTPEQSSEVLTQADQDPGLEALADDLVKIRGMLSGLAPKRPSSANRGSAARSGAHKKKTATPTPSPAPRLGLWEARSMKAAHGRAYDALH